MPVWASEAIDLTTELAPAADLLAALVHGAEDALARAASWVYLAPVAAKPMRCAEYRLWRSAPSATKANRTTVPELWKIRLAATCSLSTARFPRGRHRVLRDRWGTVRPPRERAREDPARATAARAPATLDQPGGVALGQVGDRGSGELPVIAVLGLSALCPRS